MTLTSLIDEMVDTTISFILRSLDRKIIFTNYLMRIDCGSIYLRYNKKLKEIVIANIVFDEEFQHQHIFTAYIEALKTKRCLVHSIVVELVHNPYLARYLEKLNWEKFGFPAEIELCPSFRLKLSPEGE